MMSSSKAVNARGESGFTLIDMLFVIALIALLSTLAIPGLMRAKGAAQSASAIRIAESRQQRATELRYHLWSRVLRAGPARRSARSRQRLSMRFSRPRCHRVSTFIKSGYEFSLAGIGISGAPGSCNGLAVGAASSGYAAIADLARQDARVSLFRDERRWDAL